MALPTEIHLEVLFAQSLPSMAEVRMVVSRVHCYWGVEEVTHDLSFRRPPRHLRLQEVTKRTIFSMLAGVHHPDAEDVVFWTDHISAFAHDAAAAAHEHGCGSFAVVAEIKIFDVEPPRWVLQQAAAVVPWQYVQETQEVDQVLLLPAAEERRVPPRQSSPVRKPERIRYKVGEESTTNCVICLDDFVPESQLRKTPCSHVFHESCLSRWLQESRACPLCRFALPFET
ncbi:uncharacterized protein [Typha angustifolia]|uniref:uncharacterized protein n=1 Tax=Typha angustifolia TaxID=59011 RepID=UPI003C2FA189